jgi:hypothetical protein
MNISPKTASMATEQGMGSQFVEWKAENRRRSSFALDEGQLTKMAVEANDPYSKKVPVLSKSAVLTAACLPFAIRAVTGRDVFGENAAAVTINLLLTILTTWLWW